MKNNRESQSHQKQAATEASDKKITDIESEMSKEMLQQILAMLEPRIKFHKADEEMTMDDIKIRWDVEAIRGKDTPLAHLEGESTFHKLLAPNMLPDAPRRVEQEIMDKITLPMVALVQGEANRMALEIVAADDAARDQDDRLDEDLL